MHFSRLSCAIHAPSITSFFIWSNKYYYARSPNRGSSDSVFLGSLPLGCTIYLDTVFPKTLSLCSLLNVIGQYLHPHTRSGNIIIIISSSIQPLG